MKPHKKTGKTPCSMVQLSKAPPEGTAAAEEFHPSSPEITFRGLTKKADF